MTTARVHGVASRPVLAFVALALGVGWPVLSLPALAAHGVTYGLLVPTVVVLTHRTEGREGVVRLLLRTVRWRFGGGWWLLVVAAVPALSLVLGVLLGGRLQVGAAAGRLAGDLMSLASALLLVHLAEELVWAGFVQTRLATRFGPSRGAALTALPFAGVHLPLVLAGATSSTAVATGAGGLLLLALVLRTATGLVLGATGGSVLGAAVLHASFNAANNTGSLVDHALDGVDQGLAAGIALALLASVLAVRRRRPGRRHAPRLPDAEPAPATLHHL